MAAIEPSRPVTGRLKSMLAPLGVAAAAGVAAAYVGVVDPNQAGHYPTCPFLLLTGFYCPGCGTLRAVHALTHADPVTAFGLNPLAVAVLPFLAFWWGRWMVRSWRGRPVRVKLAHPGFVYAFAALVVLFWIARNMPFGRFLAP